VSPAEARSRAHILEAIFDLYLPTGLKVFPTFWLRENGQCACGNEGCKSPGKHPVTKNGFKDATADQRQVSDWWQSYPLANLAIPTGRKAGTNGLTVFDLDAYKPGVDRVVLDILLGVKTVVSRTGNGGHHYWFVFEPRLKSWRGNDIGITGVDIRTDGGYILVPPSATRSPYVFEPGRGLSEVYLASVPEELMRHVLDCVARKRDRSRGCFRPPQSSAFRVNPDVTKTLEQMAQIVPAGRWVDSAAIRGRCPICNTRSDDSLSAIAGERVPVLVTCFTKDDADHRRLLHRWLIERGVRKDAFGVREPELLDLVSTAVERYSWRGVSGMTDRTVLLLAVLPTARKRHGASFHLDSRTVARLAAVHQTTALRSLRRLRRIGFLLQIAPADRHSVPPKSPLWCVAIAQHHQNAPSSPHDACARSANECPTFPHHSMSESATQYDAIGSDGQSHNRYNAIPDHTRCADLWWHPSSRRFSLGPACEQILRIIEGGGEKGISSVRIAARRGSKAVTGSLQRGLRRLEQAGLILRIGAERRSVLWVRAMKSEQDVAADLGVLGETERQHEMIREERRRFYLALIAKKGVGAISVKTAIGRFGPISEAVQKLLGSRYEATLDGFVDKATGALLLDLGGNPIEPRGNRS
jgi:Bifunctional DNA primase/polymerase, N-terminal